MSGLTRGGTAEPVSRDQMFRRERGQGKLYFPCSDDHVQDWQPYPVDPYYSCYMCDRTLPFRFVTTVFKTFTARCTLKILLYFTFFTSGILRIISITTTLTMSNSNNARRTATHITTASLSTMNDYDTVFLNKNPNAPRPSEHPPVRGKKCQNV